jgi:uracil phosphoribosyltransferase
MGVHSTSERRRTGPKRCYDLPVPLHLVDHSLAHDALARLRNADSDPAVFRREARRISTLLVAEALRRVPSIGGIVTTPLGPAPARVVDADIVFVPVLRAGLGMLDAALDLVPSARVGHIGLQRDEATALASQYYSRLPPSVAGSYVVLLDPMLATGGSATAAVSLIKRAGAAVICMVCVVAAPEGIAVLASDHPDVDVYTPVVDRELNARKFIVPGLGDFGDRLFGT